MTMTKDLTSKSKFLSYVLRHAPESIGLTLDEHGWTAVDDLVTKAAAAGKRINGSTLAEIVATNDKKRFTLSGDGMRIRAAQGHSVEVALNLEPYKAAGSALSRHGNPFLGGNSC